MNNLDISIDWDYTNDLDLLDFNAGIIWGSLKKSDPFLIFFKIQGTFLIKHVLMLVMSSNSYHLLL